MPWWAGRLGAGFVTAIFIGAVVTPFFFMSRENVIRQEIRSYILPAFGPTARIHASLDHELSGIIGFQAKGQRRFANLYDEGRAQVGVCVKQLSMLADHIGGDTQERWRDLDAAVVQWDSTIDQEAFLRRLMGRAEFNQELFQSEYVLEEAHQAATDFQIAMQRALELRRERIAGLDRESSLLTSIFAVVAILSLLFVWRLANHLRDAQNRLVGAAEEQKHLAEEARSRQDMAESAVRSRDEILRIVSHDLRSSLNNIALATAGLRNTSGFITEESKRLLDMIKRATDRMNSLIRNLVEIGKLEAGQDVTLDLAEFTVDSLLRDACEPAKLPAEQKKIMLSWQSTEPEVLLQADRERLLQVLTNLIDNAIKFTPQGGAVKVRCEALPSELHFSVADTGPGISEEHLSLIFERYWQVPGAKRGSGLGLTIAKRIVERHGGKIWAESKVGRGTTFKFFLPRVELVYREPSAA